MKYWKRFFHLMALLLAASFLLAACERPVPGSSDVPDDTTADTSGETADTPDETADAAAPETVETATDTPATVETAEESSDTTTPRVDAEAPPPTEEAAGEESKPTAETETAEATAETGDAVGEEEDAAATVEAAPETSGETSDTKGDSAAAETVAAVPATHTVAPGENLYRIGLQYNISWATLAEYNNLGNANRLIVGQVLNIPGETAAEVEATPSPFTETTYAVQPGDNLFLIGLKYGINWIQIAEANGLVNPNQITVGQVLKIPVNAPGPAPQFTHQVKAGETLFLIALRYGVLWPVIAEANDIDSPYVIYEGQTLVIPGSQ
jgi:LysM repeat protein